MGYVKKILFLFLFATIVFVIGNANSGEGDTTAERPGNPAVYQRIAAETDCAVLQGEFDRGEATHQRGGAWGPLGTSYMGAADTRMRQVGCY